MNVEILAAGFGTRLNEFGQQLPKGLIPYKETTLLGRMLAQLEGFDIALTSNQKFFDQYSQYLKNLKSNFPNLHVTVLNNGVEVPEKRLGALGDLKLTLDKLQWYDKDILVLASDTFFSFPISDLLAFYEKYRGFTTVFYKTDPAVIKDRLGCGVLEGDRVVNFIEKPGVPPSGFAAVPLYIYPKEVLPLVVEYIKTGRGCDSPGQIIPWLIGKNIPVWGFTYTGEYLDVGTLQDIEKLHYL